MMKKNLMSIFAVALLVFTSCDGKKPADAATTEPTATEAPAAAASSDVVTKYSEFVDKVIPLVQKMKAGDAAATQEYTKLAQELATYVQDNQDAFSKLSEADAKKYQEIAQKFAAAMQ